MKMEETLLASSPNVIMMRETIAKYYCRKNIDEVQIEGSAVILSGKTMTSVKVEVKRGRYRFLMLRPLQAKAA